MSDTIINHILEIANKTEVNETGGSHNQKGIDFQRYWTILRMLELESQGVKDFLILIEAIQDVSELDNSTEPTTIRLYQLKKKDRKEWTWNELTKLIKPKPPKVNSKPKKDDPSKPSKPPKEKEVTFSDSPLGKLYSNLISINGLEAQGRFISNRGCDLPLTAEGNAATSVITTLELLDAQYVELLKEEMTKLSNEENAIKYLAKISLEKASLDIDSMKEGMIGHMFTFLAQRSPEHVNQSCAFLDALMAVISPLGTKTDKCHTFQQLCERQGYTRNQFIAALGSLQKTPDILQVLEHWLQKLDREGANFMEITALRGAAAAYFTRQVAGSLREEDQKLIDACDSFLEDNPVENELLPVFEKSVLELQKEFPDLKKSEIMAQFALRAIKKCVDQI